MSVDCLFGKLPPGWEITTLGEACRRSGGTIQTGPFGSQLHASDYVADGTPSIMPQNIGDNRVIEEGIARIGPEDARRLSRYLVKTGDIVYSRRGDVERRALIRGRENGWLCGTGCLRVRFGTGINSAYASYYLGHPLVRDWIVRHAVGATMANLNTTILSAVPFVIPPLDEQVMIGNTLASLDDKIELNRQMNETLEAMARALFKSWFVDFDPVRAKAEGRQPAGMDAETAALFPNAFTESSQGAIPMGWNIQPIGDLVSVVGGSTPSTKVAEFWDGLFHWATPKDLSALSAPILLRTERRITEAGVSQISSGILPAGTVLLSSRAPIGYLAIAEVPVSINQGFIAMICDKCLPNYYVLQWTRFNLDTIKGRANGTTFQEISKANFRPISALVPAPPVLTRFMDIVSPLYARIKANLREQNTLAELRDLLLPKLLTGELRVKDADTLAEATV